MIFLFLRTIVPAFGRLVIYFLSRSAFFFAHTDNSFIEDFIFLQNFTAETAKAIRKPFLCNKLKEIFFRSDNLHTHLLHVGDSARWVDGGVLVYRPILDTGFFSELKNHITIFTARISQFYISIVPFLYALQETDRLLYLFL